MDSKQIKKEELLDEIKNLLKPIHPFKVILFGSYTTNHFNQESDIDLVVVLNKSGFSKNYSELLKNRIAINRLLRKIRMKIPMDILVYTKDEWAKLTTEGNRFFKEIEEHGVQLL